MFKRSVSPPPTGGVAGGAPPPGQPARSPIGFLEYSAPGWWPPTHIGDYEITNIEGPPPAGFDGLSLSYRTAVTCQNGYTNIDQTTALNNGWVLTDASGPLTNVVYGGYIADPGLPAYQTAWCNAAVTRAGQLQSGGFFIDDTTPRLDTITGGRWPTKYPNETAYRAALVSFFQFVKAFFDARGLKFSPNTAVPSDNTGALTTAWWHTIAPYCHYLSIEYWMGGEVAGGFIRRVGPEWWNNWDNFRALHSVCRSHGCGFLPLSNGGGTQLQSYSLGTFMLDWDGTRADGANIWTQNYVTTTDPWSSFYSQAIALGAPTSTAVGASNVWTRSFANGTLSVNANTATATIAGV